MKQQMMLGAALVLAALPAMAETPVAEVKYVDGAIAESLTGAPGDAAAGAKVMTNRGQGNCVACHVISAMPDVPFQGNIGPTLDGAADRWTEAELRGIVADAKHTFEGSMMPSFYKTGPYIRQGDGYTGKGFEGTLPPILTAEQVEDVVAYLVTLKE
ncbi:sulfur oxidation c-type cytochrome SoxX [Frigidibacter sp. ROC022]|uniref:sulfur oxidation c-type cytochrome SoxX n=1 Tax=Frigidibacter sp. ROC022 TaxID=2971796 RepID=UPI00215B52D3|nr:sulfur oxidation c-type cytochrome SoxX [Frigidibacter sp. ROC022]MCR8726204.1 sulfur oxidation c-type cytochrome SoxX [Frigidibacter sp. ROC022]